jgi:glycosyltransferase involved in cell wall biosynthesis
MVSLLSFARRAKLMLARLCRRDLVGAVQQVRNERCTKEYVDKVTATLVLQFFNKKENIGDLVQTLRAAPAQEVIVCDDGSIDGSFGEWLKILDGPNDFLLRANDIFEVRTYDRCIRMARGEFVVLLQDDDVAADVSGAWLTKAINIMRQDPAIVIIGGRTGLDLRAVGGSGFETYDSKRPMGPHGYRYVAAVNRAPWIVRAEGFRSLGGIDQSFAPFQHDDLEICLRAWQAGLRVAHYDAGFVRDVGTGGMRLFNDHGGDYEKDWKWRKAVKNWVTVQERYAGAVGHINELIDRAASSRGDPTM